MRRLRVAGLALALAMTAACNPFSSQSGNGSNTPTPTPTVTKTHSKIIVIVKGHQTLRVGQAAQIGTAGKGGAMLIKIGKPQVSTTSFSKGYGYAPQHGYYVNFPISIFNDGQDQLLIERLDFWVDCPGLGKINTNDGNSPVSGAHTQLDTTPLTPGDGVKNYLAFDVSSPHGTFVYGPGNKVSVAWKY